MTDLDMPDMDGLALAKTVRAVRDIPVIALSAMTTPDMIERVRQCRF